MKCATLVMLLVVTTALARPQNDPNFTCPTFCPAVISSVCGTDGKTYDNECQLKTEYCKSGGVVFVDYEGACVTGSGRGQQDQSTKRVCKEQCDREYRPVCATDGQTYNNVCMMEFAACQAGGEQAVRRVSDGPCPADEERQGRSAQIDDEDTEAPATTIPIAVTEPPVECKKECLRNFKPVCGSDGKTYHNECLLEFAACESKEEKKLVKVSNGVCPELRAREGASPPKAAPEKKEEEKKEATCNNNCIRNYKPVCGSDGITYNNECLLQAAACKNKRILKSSEGKCKQSRKEDEDAKQGAEVNQEVEAVRQVEERDEALTAPVADNCNRNCVRSFKPVCGSDGVTYNNECLLELAACKNAGNADKIAKATDGPCARKEEGGKSEQINDKCKEFKCTRELRQVCGSDGKTYNNECVLNFEACLHSTNVSVEHTGSCNSKKAGDVTGDKQDNADVVIQERAAQEETETAAKPPNTDCKPFCPLLWQPVCGSDDKTYGNECELTAKACRANSGVVVAYVGECKTTETEAAEGETTTTQPEDAVQLTPEEEDKNPCPIECSNGERPVCGSDGKTYQNLCQFNKEKCRSNRILNVVKNEACEQPNQTVETADPVKPVDPAAEPAKPAEPVVKEEEPTAVEETAFNYESCAKFCTLEFAPLCGSDSKTYSNGCHFEVENCKAKIRGEPEVTKAHDKACEEQ